MRRILLGIFGILVLSFVGAYFYLQPAPVPVESLLLAGDKYDVKILRDTWGVPHIFGKRDADVAYGLGYAHAEDDFQTIQETLLNVRGQAASVFGQSSAPTDYVVQLLRVWDVVHEKYESQLSAETRAVCEGYADGLNQFAGQNPELALPGLFPVSGKDVVAGFSLQTPLFFGLDGQIRRLFREDFKAEISEKSVAYGEEEEIELGSNTFAVAPHRSADGKTRLAINSHQPWTGPVAWYEAHLKSEEGWDMVGGTFPGAPLILHGHNRNLGWAHTVNRPDLVDMYVLKINPENENQYEFDGEWRDLGIRMAQIRVKLWGPFYWTFEQETLWSIHGPVIRQPHGAYAIRYAGYDDLRTVEQWHKMNKARNFQEWQEAMQMNALPMFNVGYADKDGNIAYFYNAKMPERHEGYDWSKFLPGETSETLWTDYAPFERLPHVINPKAGFIQNCNNTPFRTTAPEEDLNAEDFSPTFGIEAHMTNRGLRALELFDVDESITADEFYAYKFDTKYSDSSAIAKVIQHLRNVETTDDSLTKAAVDLILNWDLDTRVENRQAAISILPLRRFTGAGLDTLKAETLHRAIRGSAERLLKNFGRLDTPWGDVNRLIRGETDLAVSGGPDVLRAVYGRNTAGGRLRGTAGDCYVLLVEWDKNGAVSSQSIHQFGSATLDKNSPHYDDQAKLFVQEKMKPVWMDEEKIRENLVREYRPGDENAATKISSVK